MEPQTDTVLYYKDNSCETYDIKPEAANHLRIQEDMAQSLVFHECKLYYYRQNNFLVLS